MKNLGFTVAFAALLLLGANSFAVETVTNTSTQPITADTDLSMRGMIRLVHEEPKAFAKQWEARRQLQLQQLDPSLNPEQKAEQQRNIDWQWAAGLINYPYFRHRETGKSVPATWSARLTAIRALPFNEPQFLGKENFDALIQAWLHDQAGSLLKSEPSLKTGDNRWLRANFAVLEKGIQNKQVKAYFMGKLLAEHTDDNGAKNILPQIEQFEANLGASEQAAKFRAAYQQELQPPSDHRAFTYQSIDGVNLQAHVFEAKNITEKNDSGTLRPVFIWFHGGSWSTGHWSYCPVVCRALQNRGYTIIQVEYRTSQRFDGTPLNALADAYRIVDWTLEHATELHIDPTKIMVGGFSSGGALASQMAVLNSTKVKAAAYISGGFNPSQDSWYNTVVGPLRDTKKLSPVLMVDAKSPPQIIFHAKDDEMCAYQDAAVLHHKLEKLTIPSKLVSFEQGGHFFVFKNPTDRQRIVTELNQFLNQIKW